MNNNFSSNSYLQNNSSPEINKNYSFVKNNETYNKKLFDRNFLMSEISMRPNSNPSYFNEQHYENRKGAEELFNKRFANLNVENISNAKKGYVDFSVNNNISSRDIESNSNKNNNNNMSNLEFTGKYSEYFR